MPDIIEIQQYRNFVKRAVRTFIDNDSILLLGKMHEQAICHRIAVYLEGFFGLGTDFSLNVDCEYNKHLEEPKVTQIEPAYFLDQFRRCQCAACREMKMALKENKDFDLTQTAEVEFRPDILVHSRGNDDMNLIAIEVKKVSTCPFDLAKLRALTQPNPADNPFGYKLGLFLNFPNDQPHYIWVQNGEIQPLEEDTPAEYCVSEALLQKLGHRPIRQIDTTSDGMKPS